jgi:predicted amidohydrolase YtcJ
VLAALAEARREEARHGGPRLRHRIEHVQVLHPDDLGRLAELDLVASMQPIHATSDMVIADRYWGARSAGAYAFRSLLTPGTALAFGSDSPVETLSPLAGIHAAVTRRRADGSPGEAGWQSQERLTVAEALRAYTAGPALAAGEETDKGSLAPGRLADLVVLDRDLTAVPPMEIRELRVLGTMVGGAWAWSDRDFDPGDGHGP